MIRFADAREWWLELSPMVQAEAVQQSQPWSTADSRHRAYLNRVCLHEFLNWIRAEVPQAHPWMPSDTLPAVWDVVNGTAVMVGTTRLVLIPTEVIDDDELEVPQEWVDIPSWAGDYYLAVQVKPESGWMRIWGYATHQELKSIGHYDPSDRTYSLDTEQLTRDLNAFWLTFQLCSTESARAALLPLPQLAPAQAENLIQRLGNPAVMFPRLTVPFSLWGALLEQETWRQQLFQYRTGIQPSTSTIVRLGAWLQGNFTAAWQAIEAVLSPQQTAIAWRNDPASEPTAFEVSRVKVLELGAQPGDEQIALVIGIKPTIESSVLIGLQICPTGDNLLLPDPIQIRLLDAAGREVGQASAAVTEIIQLQFEGCSGEQFQVEIISGNHHLIQEFEI
jgi:hypothetical protein